MSLAQVTRLDPDPKHPPGTQMYLSQVTPKPEDAAEGRDTQASPLQGAPPPPQLCPQLPPGREVQGSLYIPGDPESSLGFRIWAVPPSPGAG